MYAEAEAKIEEAGRESPALEQIQQLESQYLMQTYARAPAMFVRGKARRSTTTRARAISISSGASASTSWATTTRECEGRCAIRRTCCTLQIFITTRIKGSSPSVW